MNVTIKTEDISVPRLSELHNTTPPKVSFEFFPPKTDEMEEKLWSSISKLAPIDPHFVSVTYGAGGSTRQRTHSTVKRIIEETDLKPAAHLTCIGATKSEIDDIVRNYWQMGVRHIVALRGDLPEGMDDIDPNQDGYRYANELVEGIKKIADFEISVAAYPEKHPQAISLDQDIDYLKKKVDVGATRAITQFFLDTDSYLRFIDKTMKAGIEIPVVPGILPITNYQQAVKFSKQCGVSIPEWIQKLFHGLDDDPVKRNLVSVIVAIEQCELLRNAGVDEFHFYTLNRAELTQAICHILGARSKDIRSA
ncbi:MAG: methylenetetrahydrofolate reductase [NAD(P)H] [Rickettsiales bacterium]|nr:methylenetetrahydrofolate reductase [NAD(P)H] [Rickettsiales bacterium]